MNVPITPTVPATLNLDDYLLDAHGRLVQKTNINDADLLRNDLVCELVAEVQDIATSLAHLKADLLERVAEHIALVASTYGVDIAGNAGAVRLVSYDGRFKIERTSADRVVVGEQIHAAEALVRNYLAEATREAAPALIAIVDRAFRRNGKTGQLNVARLLDFVAVRIDDPRWQQAQQAIRDSLQTQESVTYFRAYQRADVTQPWQQIPLDFSHIVPRGADLISADPDLDPAGPEALDGGATA
jgi:hypothetical protein